MPTTRRSKITTAEAEENDQQKTSPGHFVQSTDTDTAVTPTADTAVPDIPDLCANETKPKAPTPALINEESAEKSSTPSKVAADSSGNDVQKQRTTTSTPTSWTGQIVGGIPFSSGIQQQQPTFGGGTDTASTSSILVSAPMFESPDPSAFASAAIRSASSSNDNKVNNDNSHFDNHGYPTGILSSMVTNGDDLLQPTGTTPPLPPPLHPGMMFVRHQATTPSAGFYTPGAGFGYPNPNPNDAFALPSALQSDLDETYAASSYMVDEQQGQHPGAPSHPFTVQNFNAAQKQLPSPSGFASSSAAATAGASSSPSTSPTPLEVAAAAAAAAAAAIAAVENTPDISIKGNGRKRGGNSSTGKTSSSKTNKKKAVRPNKKARTLPTASSRVGSSRTISGACGTAKSRPFTAEEQASITCKCSKSKCLKLYCDCYQSGAVCKDGCSCVGCANTVANSGPNGIRTKAVRAALLRRPDAFQLRVKKSGSGCKCKKNKCLKKYCACFGNGLNCGESCFCKSCQNMGDGDRPTPMNSVAKPVAMPVAMPVADAKPAALPVGFPPQCMDGPVRAAAAYKILQDTAATDVTPEVSTDPVAQPGFAEV